MTDHANQLKSVAFTSCNLYYHYYYDNFYFYYYYSNGESTKISPQENWLRVFCPTLGPSNQLEKATVGKCKVSV